MTIWYVDCEDLSCAWTQREDAIKYFYEQVKRCEWLISNITGQENEKDDFLIYTCVYKQDTFEVKIVPISYNEKPYW